MADIVAVGSAPQMYKVLPWRTKFSYGVGHVLNDLCASMWFSYLLVYFHAVLNFSNQLSGYLLLIGQVADAICTPLVGIESDRDQALLICRTYGRRKTWHFVGTICVLVSFPFLFIKCVGCESSPHWAQMYYYSAFVVIFQFGWASVQVSHLALIPDLTPDSHERCGLNAIRYACSVISNICVYSVTWAVIGLEARHASKIGPDNADQFRTIVLIVLAVGSVFAVIFHIGVREGGANNSNSQSNEDESLLISGGNSSPAISSCDLHEPMAWSHWLKEVQFYQVAVVYMCSRLYCNLTQVYIPLYLEESLKEKGTSIAVIPLVSFMSGFVASFFMKFLNKNIGRKATFLLGAAVGITACSWIYFIEGANYHHWQLYVVACLIGVAGSTLLVTSLSITADLIGANTESGAFVYGAMSFADKLSNGIAVIVIQDLHPCETCCGNFSDCAYYYKNVLSMVCGAACVVGIIGLLSLIPVKIGDRSGKQSKNVYRVFVEEAPLDHSDDEAVSPPVPSIQNG